MNRFSRLAALALLPCLMLAQETRMIRLQHADPHRVRDLLVGTGARAQWDDVLRVIVVSGSPSEVNSLEQAAKELDSETAKVGVSNIELTMYVLGASEDDAGRSRVPPSLQKTVDQIKAAFPYKSYRLLESSVARSRIGENTEVSGSLQPFQDHQQDAIMPPPSYSLSFQLAGITNSAPHDLFHIRGFLFRAGFPISTGKDSGGRTQYQQSPATVRTNFDIASNQQVVIGKAGVAGNSAVFLIVEAKSVK
jgi:hypothetical protein